MNELLTIGFLQVGFWEIANNRLSLAGNKDHGNGWLKCQSNVLYAFVEDQEVRYVGKTTRTFSKRMYGYMRPVATQSTNVRLNQILLDSLMTGNDICIFALPDHGQLRYGTFQLNLAAGLEDSMIRELKPAWNLGHQDTSVDASLDSMPVSPTESFAFIFQPTYYQQGFFNVPVSHASFIGSDGETMSIECSGLNYRIVALINRRANSNGSPRIMGGRDLKNWFRKFTRLESKITVEVRSKCEICLRCNL